ncbi:hypothetical protein [Mycolicibacter sinensis]|uniref:Secreted protein n=1 Tax=Mycolicibacter sinensis (strain JDM601) TaxID=875328 RepID=A0A1A2XQD7_MYCSD|nr:hypothetical protein [Mycolicibacter sinensis]OBH15166.1 hypothetical protein A5694_10530 [Mycolicibacter sinensis]OBI27964.1 hypothetical protein A5710_04520 [Mycolicibacter sinensis]
MRRLVRGLIACVVAMAASGGLAAEAGADDDAAPEGTLEGIYTYNGAGITATWKIYPLCVPTVGDGRVPLHLAVGCKLQVESDGPPGQAGAYRLSNGLWSYHTPLLAGKKCPDGKTAASEEMYQFDTSLRGTYTQSHAAVCGEQPGLDKHPFTLTFVSPLPNPVVHYPLTCQDNPIHLCS